MNVVLTGPMSLQWSVRAGTFRCRTLSGLRMPLKWSPGLCCNQCLEAECLVRPRRGFRMGTADAVPQRWFPVQSDPHQNPTCSNERSRGASTGVIDVSALSASSNAQTDVHRSGHARLRRLVQPRYGLRTRLASQTAVAERTTGRGIFVSLPAVFRKETCTLPPPYLQCRNV